MAEPHRTPDFQNAVEYTVAVTFTVRGGARPGTAHRRARDLAERLADTAARAAQVVDVTARAGCSHDGEMDSPERVRFATANTGSGTYGGPGKLDRYLDPDHELALRSLADANEAYEERRRADRARRHEVSCRNTYALGPAQYCICVYCAPGRHHDSLQALRQHPDNPFVERYCPCGQMVGKAGERCPRHRAATIVALDGDDVLIHRLAARQYDQGRESSPEQRPGREERPPPDHGLDR